MTADLAGVRIWGGERVVHGSLCIGPHLGVDCSEILVGRKPLLLQPSPKVLDRVTFGLPVGLFLFRAVVVAIGVAHVMAHVAIGVENDKERPIALAGATDKRLRQPEDCENVLA